MEKTKNVQIPEKLLLDLFKYFLFRIGDPDQELEAAIRIGLEAKLEAMINRDLYTKSFLAQTKEEQEQARQAYLDRVGVPPSFRWSRDYEERRRRHD